MLSWLNSDRDLAGEKYEAIRRRLIKYFVCRGCPDPEDLADLTITRVASKVVEISGNYVGDPASYFGGVAQMIFLESLRNRKRTDPLSDAQAVVTPPLDEERERMLDCLEHCLGKLPPNQSELVLDYYQEDKQAKIDYRKMLAQRLGIAANALRIRAHRIRLTLEECMQKCLEANAAG